MNPTEPPASAPEESPLMFDWRHRPPDVAQANGVSFNSVIRASGGIFVIPTAHSASSPRHALASKHHAGPGLAG